ncbi:hypothetical protein ASF27_01685 [Methylobacterium sp. Leaf102]|uniref:head-tail connector protein n=1 Tax=Methylobacterium sp. Leaf102 TaxID=1736253 RepID=UPI0006F794B9|nr:head-tail connector protein [Methylobacterium sp. Leaf102]KQP34298.1 hypothetical protein ASF27_01685 [Methylobacterium sp. Leaf102]
MRVRVVTPPAPILTVEQAKRHLRVEGGDEDAYIVDLIAVATAWIDGPDGWLGRALGEQVLEAVVPSSAWAGERWLPLPPLLDILGETPSDAGFITVRYRAGYAGGAVPAPIRHAILLMVGHLYENRMAVTAATHMGAMPMGVDALLSPYRVWSV